VKRAVVGDAEHFDAIGFEVLAVREQCFAILHLERNVLNPLWRVWVTPHRRLRRQLEERQHVAAAGVEKTCMYGSGSLVDGTWSSAIASTKSMLSIFWYQSTVSLASRQR
jgi:hypothetical protein